MKFSIKNYNESCIDETGKKFNTRLNELLRSSDLETNKQTNKQTEVVKVSNVTTKASRKEIWKNS